MLSDLSFQRALKHTLDQPGQQTALTSESDTIGLSLGNQLISHQRQRRIRRQHQLSRHRRLNLVSRIRIHT